jgi:hypothetical protein
MLIFRLPENSASGGQEDSGLGVAGVVPLDALWQKPLATALTATRQGGSAALGFHSRTEPVLTLARAF